MNQVKHILAILAFSIGTSLALTSCGGDDEGPDTIVLNGLWEITEIEVVPVEEETTEETTEEETTGDDTTEGDTTEGDTSDGDTSEGEGEAGAGSPPAKAEGDNGDETTDGDNTEPVADLGYMRFGMITYEYFMVEEEKVTTVHSGTYQLAGKTLSFTEDEASSEIHVALIELKGQQLTMNMTIDGEAQIWYAQKMAEDPFLDEDGEQGKLVDFENEVHSADSIPGSLLNPDLMILNDTLFGTLDTLISKETYKAEQFLYLKVDTAKTYQLTVQIIDPQYDLPAAIMEYVQVWLSYQPLPRTTRRKRIASNPKKTRPCLVILKVPPATFTSDSSAIKTK